MPTIRKDDSHGEREQHRGESARRELIERVLSLSDQQIELENRLVEVRDQKFDAMQPVSAQASRLLDELAGHGDRDFATFSMRSNGNLHTTFRSAEADIVIRKLEKAKISFIETRLDFDKGGRVSLEVDPGQDRFFDKLVTAVAKLRLRKHREATTYPTSEREMRQEVEEQLWSGITAGRGEPALSR